MKYGLTIILTIWLITPSIGQLKEVIFFSQQADEPPTRQGRPTYSIRFKLTESGDFVASDYYENRTRRKLKSKATIDKATVEKALEWRRTNKNHFTPLELGFDVGSLRARKSEYKLNFDIPSDLVVKVDSFHFCQAQKMMESFSTGGQLVTVSLTFPSVTDRDYTFRSDDIENGDFDIRNYIVFYILLGDKIPNEIPNYSFFSRDRFLDIMLYYQKTVECEGFYYKEYSDKNLQMTPQEKRTMTGWDFVKYMGQRGKKK